MGAGAYFTLGAALVGGVFGCTFANGAPPLFLASDCLCSLCIFATGIVVLNRRHCIMCEYSRQGGHFWAKNALDGMEQKKLGA